MMIPGEIEKEGNHYSALLEVLGLYGTGRSRKAACDSLVAMVLEYAAHFHPRDGFTVTVTDDGEATLYLTSNDPAHLVAMVLRRQREYHQLSLADVMEVMGTKSRNGYAQYEQGRSEPSIGKLRTLLAAVAPELTLAIVPRTARVLPRSVEERGDAEEIEAVMRDPSPANVRALKAKHQSHRKARFLPRGPSARRPPASV